MRMRHIVIYGLYDFYDIFLHYVIKGTIFKKKKLPNINCEFDFIYNVCLKHFSF
jgi:hypothetical protein